MSVIEDFPDIWQFTSGPANYGHIEGPRPPDPQAGHQWPPPGRVHVRGYVRTPWGVVLIHIWKQREDKPETIYVVHTRARALHFRERRIRSARGIAVVARKLMKHLDTLTVEQVEDLGSHSGPSSY